VKPVVVVGAGMGGLAAALRLAAAGRPVEVLERATGPGGKAGVVTLDGVEVDTGPSVVTLPAVFDAILGHAGLRLRDVVEVFLPSPACRYVWSDGRVLDVHSDRAATRASVAAARGATAARELDAFLDASRRIWEAAAPPFVLGPAPTLGRIAALGPSAWRSVPRIEALSTMDRGIARRVRTPELVDVLRRYATYNGSDPRRAPGTLNCIAHVELGLGVHGVVGGIGALVRGLVDVAERLGVRFAYGADVAAIRVERGRAVGVETRDGTLHPASAIVANADAAHVLADLLPPGTRHGLATALPPSTSGWVGIVRARRRADRAAHTVLFPSRPYVGEFEDLFDHDRPPEEPTVYLCAQEKAHRRVGWADHEPVFIMANAPAEPVDRPRDPATWPALRAVVEARLRSSGLIDADDAVVWERSPRGLADAFPGTRGAIYGAASNDAFAAFRRPPNRVAKVPGLYLASGSAHPGGGLPLCAQSGSAAADAVLADLGQGGP
jgi:phytoene desaturase